LSFRKIVVPVVVCVAVTMAIISIAYPSVVVSNSSTQPIPNFATYTIQYATGYPQMTASTILTGYSTMTAWYPGNPICDPTSNACMPYPTPTATLVYAQSATYNYQVTLNSEATSTYTSQFTSFSTQTNYQTIPPYAAAGLSELGFGLVALLVVAVVAAAILFLFVRDASRSNVRKAELPSKTVRYCQHCGAENRKADEFCGQCGTILE
jgi:zinc ribbon protein